MEFIFKIEDVKVGDIAYYEGAEDGAVVVKVDPLDDRARLKIETPEEYKPFNIDGDSSVWLRNSCFEHAIRPTQNKFVGKRLPNMRGGNVRVFETLSGTRIIYRGLFRGWRIESHLDDKRLLELLDTSQFPLKDITEEES